MTERMTELVQARVPPAVAAAVEREARQRLISKSAVVRWLLAERLGLIQGEPAQEREQPAR